jgi:hypothetical protein
MGHYLNRPADPHGSVLNLIRAFRAPGQSLSLCRAASWNVGASDLAV